MKPEHVECHTTHQKRQTLDTSFTRSAFFIPLLHNVTHIYRFTTYDQTGYKGDNIIYVCTFLLLSLLETGFVPKIISREVRMSLYGS